MRNLHIAIVMAATLGLSACGNQTIPLPEVKASDPVSQLNPDRWQATVNDLMLPPGDGAPHPLPAPVRTGSNEVPAL
jgi:hypothetical protein